MADPFDFEIYFFGLICIHGKDPSRNADGRKKVRAMLLDDSEHTPSIYLGSETRNDLKRKSHVIFQLLPEDEADRLDSFDKFAPHLRDLTKDPTKLDLNAACVDIKLPAGRLVTVDRYNSRAQYKFGDVVVPRDTECVSRLTMLNVKTFAPEVRVLFTTKDSVHHDEPVSSSGFVLLTNAERDKADGDFKKHSKATDHDASYLADLHEPGDPRCRDPIQNPPDIKAVHLPTVLTIIETHPVFEHPECSNTQWP